jgi:hypothetical protein
MSSVDCVFRFNDLETFIDKLAALGVTTKPAVDEEGNAHTIEQRAGVVMTPCLTTSINDLVSCVRLAPEHVALISDVTSPAFLCDWRSDEVIEVEELDEEGNVILVEQPLPWPEYEVVAYDIDGNIAGTRMQGCGKIG